MHLKVRAGRLVPGGSTSNNLLSALRSTDARILEPVLEEWSGSGGDILCEPGTTVRYVYFPCGPSLVSYLIVLESSRPMEVSLIGREGAAGGIVSQGRLPAFARAEVQFPGPFLRIETAALEDAKMQSLTLRHLFARYADCLFAQVFQAVACNGAHSIEQRTAKWLIHAMDRTGTSAIPLTQEQLAAMLGVGRSYISRVIGALKVRRILDTRRGALVVTDLRRLKELSCRCNDHVRRHFDDVLRGVYPSGDETLLDAGATTSA